MSVIFVVLTSLCAFVSGIIIGVLIAIANNEWKGDD